MKILVLASDKGGKFVPFIEEQITALQQVDVEIIRYGVTGKGITGYLRELPKLKRFIRAERPDLIHAHYGLCGLLANLQRSVPVVTTYHGSDINLPKVRRLSKISISLSRWNIFVSKRMIEIAIRRRGEEAKRREEKHTLLPCGVNIPQPWNELQNKLVGQLTLNQWVQSVLNKDAKNILFAGAFNNAVKDSELAKEAIALYNSAISNEQWDMGINSQSPIANRPINLIELKGYNRDQVNALMYNCDAFLMTSKTEGSPQVVKEALACGCPIVSVDVGDVAERTSGVEGCYVVPSREPKDVAQAILQTIAYEGKTNGRDKIIEMGLSNELVAKQLMEIYKSILA